MKIRISWINQYLFCPYGFYLQHVLGLEPIKTKSLSIGARVHAELKRKYEEEGWENVNIWEALQRAKEKGEIFKYRERWVDANFEKWDLVGKVDELWIYPDRVEIIEDKPGNHAYDGSKYQVMGYALAFKSFYNISLPIKIAVRNRDTMELLWHEEFDEIKEKDIVRVIEEMYQILDRKIIPEAIPSPNKCEHCGFRDFCDRRM